MIGRPMTRPAPDHAATNRRPVEGKDMTELNASSPAQLTAAIRAVYGIHGAIDAVQYLGTRQIPRRVCSGCGSDDGNWQLWPCPTIRAVATALAEETKP